VPPEFVAEANELIVPAVGVKSLGVHWMPEADHVGRPPE
jgi:hypothetical protein